MRRSSILRSPGLGLVRARRERPVRWTVVTRASELNILVDDTYELAAYRPA
jgi:hypothetical protein